MIRVNDALCTILGRSREDLLRMSFLEYIHQDDREDEATRYAKQVSGELGSYTIRKRATKPDGTRLDLDVHSSSVRDEHGSFRHGVQVVQDVTEAKRMDDRLRCGSIAALATAHNASAMRGTYVKSAWWR